ncbi:helix-turn-helix transcriptional regulator [Kutzneria sp. NPDC051319]|uniref:helix-turn-helix domain-containing protein n=1 Tax=Kutzneria sp. NPDC051319 TaxID=3155047 RepID=UPI003414A222
MVDVDEPERLQALRRALGERLKIFRTAADISQGQLGRSLYCDRTLVTKLEAGQRSKDRRFWQQADALLKASGALLAAFDDLEAAKLAQEAAQREAALVEFQAAANQLRREIVPLAERPSALAPNASPTEFLARIAVASPVPAHIGWSDVDQMRATTKAFALSENMFGGGLSCEAAEGQLRWSARLLEAQASNDVGRAMHEAVGNLAGVVAFSAFDIGDQDAAGEYFRFALWCADRGGSWPLRATILADMARQAAYRGDLDEALSLIEFACVRSDRLPATGRAMVTTMRARYLSLLNRHDEARTEVDRADAYFTERCPEEDPPWLVYYDEAEHQGSTARALTPFAVASRRPELAAERLGAAIRLHSNQYPRSRAFSRVRLATLTMRADDPRKAAKIGLEAVTDAAVLHSRRVTDELRILDRVAERHNSISEVAELRSLLKPAIGTK